ncbi:MAG: MFS transporter [Ktedonobacteraceae bacterium]|nr:MFS transporter [Ktedonobacteraceae bacterium]
MQRRVGNMRWGIAVLLGLGVIINYFDRTNIAVAGVSLSTEYHLSSAQFGFVASAYLWTYALIQVPIGALLDRIGVKWMTRVGTVLWSLATFMTAIVSGYGLIILSRLILGIAEAPVFPAASKATGYWFPMNERGLATSAFDAAAKVSNVIGVPFVAFIVSLYGWRGAFWATGVLSVLYGILFWIMYRDPSQSKRLSSEERTYIEEGGAQTDSVAPANTLASLGYLLRQPKIWGMALGFAAYGYTFYLFLTWLPSYIEKQLHVSILKSAGLVAIIWGVATITDIVIGGWLVDYLIKRGNDPTRVRKTIFIIGMVMGIAIIGAAFTTSVPLIVMWLSISLGGLAFAAPVGWSIPSLIAPKGTVGVVGAIMNFFNNIAGIIAPLVAGFILDTTKSFVLNFIIAAIILVLGILCYLLLLGKIEQLPAQFEEKRVDEVVPNVGD